MKTRKQWIAMLLMLAMLFTALPMAAFAEGEPTEPVADAETVEAKTPAEENAGNTAMKPMQAPAKTTQPIYVMWKDGDNLPTYNTADQGKEVQVLVEVIYDCTDLSGESESKTKWFPSSLKVGENKVWEFPLSWLEKLDEVQDIKIESIKTVPYSGKSTIYGTGITGRTVDGVDMVTMDMAQNMNTDVEVKKEENAIILEEDQADLKIRYWAEKFYDPITESKGVAKGNDGKPIEVTLLFKEGKETLALDTYSTTYHFFYGIVQNSLDLYSGTIGKYKKFVLHAEFNPGTDERKEELSKRYSLEPTGDDLTGWTLTLKSKIKEKKVEKVREEIPFDTEEIEDSTLSEGTRKVIQQGVNGTKITYAVSYYVKDANGREETVKDLGEKIEVTEPVKQIVHVGTKKVTPSKPSVPSEIVEIVFNANEGAWANGETRRVYRRAVGSTITIESAPMREGYKFLYWKGSKFYPGEDFTVPTNGHRFVAQWEKDEKKPEEKPSVDSKIKTPRGSALTPEEIAKILAGSKKVVPAIPKAGVGR